MVHHGVEHDRHHKSVRDAVVLDGRETSFGIERGHEAAAAAPHHQRIDHCRICNVKHGGGVQPHPIAIDGQRHRAVHGVGIQILVGQHHALGPARGPAGVEQCCHIAVVRRGLFRRGWRRSRQARFVVRQARGASGVPGKQIPQLWQASAQRRRDARETVVYDQQARARIREAEGDLGGVPSDVDGHDYRARQRHGMVQLEIAQRVQHQHRDAVARLDAQIAQRIGYARHAIGEFAEGDRAIALVSRHGIRVKLTGAPQRISHVHRYGLPSTITHATEPGPPRLWTKPSSASRTWRAPA